MREKELIVYKEFPGQEGALFYDMAWLLEHYEEKAKKEEARTVCCSCMHRLFEMAENHGFYGNLWHCYLANLLVNNENSYSRACEIRGKVGGTINQAACHDIEIFKEFFDFDFRKMAKELHMDEFKMILDYEGADGESKVYNSRIRDRICSLAVKFTKDHTPEEMKDTLTEFYRDYGVGKFGLHKAFRVVHGEAGVEIVPIRNIAHVHLDDLVGYEIPKKKLVENTLAFVEGRKANNCLLFGDAGTGKSSSIKGIANEYYDRGLRIIEMYKHQFQDLNEVITQVKNRNYKFIIYMDDLSFEEFEIDLVREKFSDKEERRDDLHAGDTVQEKLSLVSRFGVTIFFAAPDKKEFQNIVRVLAERYGVEMPEEELFLEANKWELAHSGLSGRCARQFIDYLLGTRRKEEVCR